LGAVWVSFQRSAPKCVHLSDHAPWTLKLVPFKGNKSERPWDGTFLGLFMEGCRAEVPMGCVRIVRLSEKRPPRLLSS
jgi:hypothetical protein